jgi:hypothetical protein
MSGNPINCMSDGIPGNVMDIYCWISSTFSIPEKWVGKQGKGFFYMFGHLLLDLVSLLCSIPEKYGTK